MVVVVLAPGDGGLVPGTGAAPLPAAGPVFPRRDESGPRWWWSCGAGAAGRGGQRGAGLDGALLHVGLLGQLEVPDGLTHIVEQVGGAGVGRGAALHVAADAALGEGHATGHI